MADATTLHEILEKLARKGFYIPSYAQTQAAGTAAGATSGFFNMVPLWNRIGTTLPGTRVAPPYLTAPDDSTVLAQAYGYGNQSRGLWLGWTYLLGTLNLAATGNQFTHDAATFPVLRTRMGQASQPVPLWPLVYVTTATSVVAPQFRLRNVAGTDGYVDQDGNTVVGTKVFTCPAAATAIQSGFMLPLEIGDYAIRDIVSIETTVAGTTGAMSVFGFEPICPLYSASASSFMGGVDTIGEFLNPSDIRPAVATAGTVVASLGMMTVQSASGAAQSEAWHDILGFKNS